MSEDEELLSGLQECVDFFTRPDGSLTPAAKGLINLRDRFNFLKSEVVLRDMELRRLGFRIIELESKLAVKAEPVAAPSAPIR